MTDMKGPEKYDFINIHDHGAEPIDGVFTIDNIMVHENRYPADINGIAYSCGAHPWNIMEDNIDKMISKVKEYASLPNVIAIGEAGFDRIRGSDEILQEKAFIAQVEISEEKGKPLFIHCVKAWDKLLVSHKKMNPKMKWIIHGFRGKPELAKQLLDKGFYLSPWVEWAIRPESTSTLKSIPLKRLFLETDGFDIGIEPVYRVVAEHLQIGLQTLKKSIYDNFYNVFYKSSLV
ncbi:MAG: TatD family hydrolase [Bacteroidales bacterium]|nr:TatD family hydrolase [Bacteroidales bacterium]